MFKGSTLALGSSKIISQRGTSSTRDLLQHTKDTFQTPRNDDSKLSMLGLKNLSDDIAILKTSIACSIAQTTRSHIKGPAFPPTSARSSANHFNLDFAGKGISAGSSVFSGIAIHKIHEKIIVDLTEDHTNSTCLRHLTRLFLVTEPKGQKVFMNLDGNRKHFSVRTAKRIVEALEEDLRGCRKPKLGSAIEAKMMGDIQKRFQLQYSLIQDLDEGVTELVNLSSQAIADFKYKKILDLLLKEFVEVSYRTGNSELILYSLYVQARVAMIRNEFVEAIALFKNYKNICIAHKLYKNRVFAYKHLGMCYHEVSKHKVSLIYYTKFLQMAWALDNTKYEMSAYDYIGKQHYYLLNIGKAVRFHNKMMAGSAESKESRLRLIGITRINIREAKDKYRAVQQPGAAERHEAGDIRKDTENEEVSSLDEAIDLPTPPPEESEFGPRREEIMEKNMSELGINLKTHFNKLKLEKALKNMTTKKKNSGHMRQASWSKGSGLEELSPSKFGLKSKDADRIVELKLKPRGICNFKPSEQILMSHKSRNRNIQNYFGDGKSTEHELEFRGELESHVSPAVAHALKKLLEKLRINLTLVKESLQVFASKERVSLPPIMSSQRGLR